MNLRFLIYRFARIFTGPLLWSIFIALCGPAVLIASRLTGFMPERALQTALGCQIFSWAVFLLLFFRNWESAAKTARHFDERFHAGNRYETYLQLADSEHILRERQKNETKAFYKGRRLPLYFYLSLILPAVLLTANISVLRPAPETEKAGPATPEVSEVIAPAPAGDVRLVMLQPEKDGDARSIDVITWDGAGESDAGFTQIHMTVYVNGELVRENVPEGDAPKAGKIRFGGKVPLDLLYVRPYDIVTLRLRGIVPDGKEQREVYSDARFISILPFEQKRRKPQALTGEQKAVKEALLKITGEQMRLNHDAIADALHIPPLTKTDKSQAVRQKEIAQKIEAQLASKNAEKIPAGTINEMKRARNEMQIAAKETDPRAALNAQIRATEHLTASLKRVAPETDSSDSTQNALLKTLAAQDLDVDEIISEVDNLIAELRPESADGSMPEEKSEFRPAVISSSENAYDKAVREEKIDTAMQKVRTQSDKNTAAALKKAQESVAALTEKMQKREVTPKQAESEIIAIASELARAAEKEQREGTRQNAELLAETASALFEETVRKPLRAGDEDGQKTAEQLKNIVADASRPQASGQHSLEKTVRALENVREKERHGDWRRAAEYAKEKKEALLQAKDTLEHMPGGNPEKNAALRAVVNAMEEPKSAKQTDQARQRIADLADKLAKNETGWKPEPPKVLQAPVLLAEKNRFLQLAVVKKEQRELNDKVESRSIRLEDAVREQEKINLKLDAAGGVREASEMMKNNSAALASGKTAPVLASAKKIDDALQKQLDEIRTASDEKTAKALQKAEKAAAGLKSAVPDEKSLRAIAEDLYKAAVQENVSGTRSNAEFLSAVADRLKDNLKDPNPGRALEELEKDLKEAQRARESARQTLAESLKKIGEKREALLSRDQDVREVAAKETKDLLKNAENTVAPLDGDAAKETARALRNAAEDPLAVKQLDAAVSRMENLAGNMEQEKIAEQAPELMESKASEANPAVSGQEPYIRPAAQTDNPHLHLTTLADRQAQLNRDVKQNRVNNQTAAVRQAEIMNQMNFTPEAPANTAQTMKNASDLYHRNQPEAARQQGEAAEKQLRETAAQIRRESDSRTAEAVASAESIYNSGYGKDTLNKVAERLSQAAETEQKKGTPQNAAMLSGMAHDIRQKVEDKDLGTASEETRSLLVGAQVGGGNAAPARALAEHAAELKETRDALQRMANQHGGSTEKQLAFVEASTLLREAEMAVDQFAGLPPGMAQEMQAAKRALSNARENPASLKQLDTAVERLGGLAGHVQDPSSAENPANAEQPPARLNPKDNPYSRLTEMERKQRNVADTARTAPANELKKAQDEVNKELQDTANMPCFASSKDYENMMKDSMRDAATAASRLQANQGAGAQQPAYQVANRLNSAAERIRQNSDKATAAVAAETSKRLQDVERNLNSGINQKKNIEKLAADVEEAAKKELASGTLENAEFLAETAASVRAVVGPDEEGALLNRQEQKDAVAEIRRNLAAPRHDHEASAAAIEREMTELTAKSTSAEDKQRKLSRTGDIISRIETRDQNVRRRMDEANGAIRSAINRTDSAEAVENALTKIDALGSELASAAAKREPEDAEKAKREFRKPALAQDDNAFSRLAALEREQRKLAEKTGNNEIPPEQLEKPQKELNDRLNWTASLESMQINNINQRIRSLNDNLNAVQDALRRKDRNNARGMQNRVADDLRNMADSIRNNSNRSTADKLNKLAQQAEQISAKAGQAPQSETRAKLEELARKAADDAKREHLTGTRQNAELLGDTAEKLHKAAKSEDPAAAVEAVRKEIEQARKPHAAAENALKTAFNTLDSKLEKKPDEKRRALNAAADAIAELNSDRNQPPALRERLAKADKAVRTALDDRKDAVKTAIALDKLDDLLTEMKPAEAKTAGKKIEGQTIAEQLKAEPPKHAAEPPIILPRENNPFTRFLRLEQELREFTSTARDGGKSQADKLKSIRKDMMELYRLKELPEHHMPRRMNMIREIERSLEQSFAFTQANRMNEAASIAQRAADQIRQLAGQIRQDSDRKASEALNQFDRTLKEAASELKENKKSPDQIKKKLNDAAEKMERDAVREHKSGTQENAELLADLAAKLKNDVRATPAGNAGREQLARTIAKNTEKLTAARIDNAARIRYLEKTLSDLERTKDEAKPENADAAKKKTATLMNEASDILKNTDSRDNAVRQAVDQTLNELKDADEAAKKGSVQRQGQPPKSADAAAKEVLRKLDKTITELKPGTAVPPAKSPDFKDAELAAGENAYSALSKLQRTQGMFDELLKNDRPGQRPDTNKAARQQEQLGEMLKKLQTSPVFQAQDRKNDLAEALRKMTDSLNLIRANKPKEAAVQGELAAAAIDRTLNKIRQESDRTVKTRLDEAERSVQDTVRKHKEKQQTAEKTLQDLNRAADKLARAAEQEHLSGMRSNAELLAKTARGIRNTALAVKAGNALDDKLPDQAVKAVSEAKKENAAAAESLKDSLRRLMHVRNNTEKKSDPKTGKPGQATVKDPGRNKEDAKKLAEQLKAEKDAALNAIGDALKTIPPKKHHAASGISRNPADDWDAEVELPEFKGVSVAVGNNALLHLSTVAKQQQELNKEIRAGKEPEKTAARQEAIREALDKAEEILNRETGKGTPALEDVSEKMKSAATMLKNGKPDVAADRGELAAAG